MSKYANKQFWIDTSDRAVSTFAQALVAGITVSAVTDIDWLFALGTAGLAGLVSVLQSIGFRDNGDGVQDAGQHERANE